MTQKNTRNQSTKAALAAPRTQKEANQQIQALLKKNAQAMKALS